MKDKRTVIAHSSLIVVGENGREKGKRKERTFGK
jgi:hypothetical protein